VSRNLSPWLMFLQMAERHRPGYVFEAQTREGWRAWKDEALPKVLETLAMSQGGFPPTRRSWRSGSRRGSRCRGC
jgi:hypothetical protein